MPTINWKWPHTEKNNILPWYVILKNLLAIPFIAIATLSLLFAYAIIHGPRNAIPSVKEAIF